MRPAVRLFCICAILALLALSACRKAPPTANEVVAVPVSAIPLEPTDPLWDDAPEYTAALLLQDIVDPRLMKASTQEVRIRTSTDASAIGFRLQWLDAGKDDMPGPGVAVDGCAVQLPRAIEKEPPSPQMGEANRPVEITMWRADWQAWSSGRGGSIRDLYPNASVDHYPFQALPLSPAGKAEMAMRYAPARALGNLRNGPRKSPVEDMIAEGPGTLSSGENFNSSGKGIRTGDGWMVVLSRKLPAGLNPGLRTQVAFAIWEGSHGETGSRKMRSAWIPLLRR